jgi:uncharacterized protein
MDITPLIAADRRVIQSYSPGHFKISGQVYTGPVIIFPDRVIPWPLAGINALTPDDFSLFEEGAVDVILLGCGVRAFLAPPAVKAALRSRHISLEAMDTGAACRTYNILLAEGRRVAAALWPL